MDYSKPAVSVLLGHDPGWNTRFTYAPLAKDAIKRIPYVAEHRKRKADLYRDARRRSTKFGRAIRRAFDNAEQQTKDQLAALLYANP